MIKVTITKAELAKAPAPWPGATFNHRLAYLMRSLGLKLRWSIDPQPMHLLPPWRAYEDLETQSLTIWQGPEQPSEHHTMPSPLTTNATHPARRVLVREPYSDHAAWRDTFGPATFLHAWSCDGSLDAPELIPAGSTFGTDYGPRSMMAVRGY